MKTRIMFAATLGLAIFSSPELALAQRYTNYPVCAVYSWREQSCAFMNFAQCRMSISGRGGYCEANPYYEPPRRTKRKHT